MLKGSDPLSQRAASMSCSATAPSFRLFMFTDHISPFDKLALASRLSGLTRLHLISKNARTEGGHSADVTALYAGRPVFAVSYCEKEL